MKWFDAGRMYLAGLWMGVAVRVMWLRPKAGDLVHIEFRKLVSPALLSALYDNLVRAHPGVVFMVSVPEFLCFHAVAGGALEKQSSAPVEN